MGKGATVLDIKIAHSAFGAFYSAHFSILVGAQIYQRVSDLLPSAVTVFLLSDEGLISSVGDATSQNAGEQRLAPVGMALGLKAILLPKGQERVVDGLLDYYTANMNHVPAVHSMPKRGRAAREQAAAFIADILASGLTTTQKHLGTAQQQLVEIRDRYERLWLSFEKARRMIRGIGYDERSVAYSLLPGDQYIGPDADQEVFQFAQLIPTDLSGFLGLSLFVTKPAEKPARSRTKEQNRGQTEEQDGLLAVNIRRRADGLLVGAASFPYSEIKEGWIKCAFEEALPMAHGDGVLELAWLGTGGPWLALADTQADRFGDDEGRTLAVKVEKGLLDPGLDNQKHAHGHGPAERISIPGDRLHKLGSFIGGEEAELAANAELNYKAVTTDSEEGWMQTHVLKEGLVAWRLPSVLHRNSSHVAVRCETGHAQAPECLYTLVVASSNTPDGQIQKLLAQIGTEGGLPLEGVDEASDIRWRSVITAAQTPRNLRLDFPEVSQKPQDIVLSARSVTGSNSYGYARWFDLEIGVEVADDVIAAALNPAVLAEGSRQNWQIRTHRLSELVGKVLFYQGRAEQAALTGKLGFSPIMMSEDTGSLQTHPYQGKPSVGILPNGIPGRTWRISCEVGTAHASAPAFTYMLGVLPSGAQDRQALVQTMLESVKAGDSVGSDKEQGIYWQSITLKAMDMQALALDLDGSDEVRDVVFAAMAAEGNDAYGWCRWYSFDIIIADERPATVFLSREPGGR